MDISFYKKNGYLINKIFSDTEIDLLKKKISEKIFKDLNSNEQKKIELKKIKKFDLYKKIKKKIIKSDQRYIKLPKKILKKISNNKIISQVLKNNWDNNKYTIKIIRSKKKTEIISNACGFRITEPQKKSIGIHCDAVFFSKILKQKVNNKFLKSIWVPLEGFSNKYSLKIGPRSHKFQHPNNKFEKKGSYFFKNSYSKNFKFKRNNLKKGEGIVFHPNLLHGNSHNLGKYTRLSLEIRLYNLNEIKKWNLR